MAFKNLSDFRQEFPDSWNIFGPAMKIPHALLIEGDGLTRKEIIDLTELSNEEYEQGIKYLLEQKEITFIERARGRKFSLDKKLRGVLNISYR